MAIELQLGIFKTACIDFGRIFKGELKINSRFSYIFDLNLFTLDVCKFDIKVKLQFINN
jgi:hypothetical protein